MINKVWISAIIIIGENARTNSEVIHAFNSYPNIN